MGEIIVKSIKPNGFYLKSFKISKRDYEKIGDLAMEAMTRATEGVVKDCLKKSGGKSTTSPAFIKHFFASFGPLIWAFEKNKEDDTDSHYTTLTELALRNAGYGNLASLVNKCTDQLHDDIEEFGDQADLDEIDLDEDEGELF
jgi:hypothetical protein